VEVRVGLSVLLLQRGSVGPGAYHCAVTVPEDRFAEAKAWLQKRVSLLERDGLDEFALGAPWNSQSLCYAGPDGILLELIARHDLAASSSGRFSSADLLRISEIGLAVPDVPAAVASLQNAFGLPVFGTASSEFTPLGDPDGLLIDRGPAGPTMVPHHDPHAVAGPYRCHRRAAKRREVGGTDRELPSQGRVKPPLAPR
jgi:hypothetical protein